MTTYQLERANARLSKDLTEWQKAALGLLALSVTVNACLSGLLGWQHRERLDLEAQVRQAEAIRDKAVQELGAVCLDYAKERQAREEQARAYEAIGAWEYIGECTVTAYCPCAECCGKWADGVTATGVPAVPGIVAVDPEVIPLGSTVIIDGQKYLAADTGVKGKTVDICQTSHNAAAAFGAQTAEIWVFPRGKEEPNGGINHQG